jgi:hypothetical protein
MYWNCQWCLVERQETTSGGCTNIVSSLVLLIARSRVSHRLISLRAKSQPSMFWQVNQPHHHLLFKLVLKLIDGNRKSKKDTGKGSWLTRNSASLRLLTLSARPCKVYG